VQGLGHSIGGLYRVCLQKLTWIFRMLPHRAEKQSGGRQRLTRLIGPG
jgi:hypothetical protein